MNPDGQLEQQQVGKSHLNRPSLKLTGSVAVKLLVLAADVEQVGRAGVEVAAGDPNTLRSLSSTALGVMLSSLRCRCRDPEASAGV